MEQKTISPHVTLAHGGAILLMIGWILALFARYENHIILLTITAPLSHFLLHLYGNRDTVWYDKGIIMGLGGACTYVAAATSSIGALIFLFTHRNAVNALRLKLVLAVTR